MCLFLHKPAPDTRKTGEKLRMKVAPGTGKTGDKPPLLPHRR
jgi:hypothetical protein